MDTYGHLYEGAEAAAIAQFEAYLSKQYAPSESHRDPSDECPEPQVSAESSDGAYRDRTGDLQLAKPNRTVCAVNGFSAKDASEQAFLGSRKCRRLPPRLAVCASDVGHMWDRSVARFVNGQRFAHFECICVSAVAALGRRPAC